MEREARLARGDEEEEEDEEEANIYAVDDEVCDGYGMLLFSVFCAASFKEELFH